MRRRYRQDPVTGEFHEVTQETARPLAPVVWDDLPPYESPVTGKLIDGRKARREDLKRHRCRPYEGREQEQKEAARYRAETERKLDTLAERMAHRAWAEAPERVRKVFRGK